MILIGILIIGYWKNHRKTFNGLAHWGIGTTLSGIGLIGLMFQMQVPGYISILMANVAVFAGVIFTVRGIILFCGKQPSNLTDLVVIIFVVLGFSIFTFLVPNTSIRIILASSVGFFQTVRAAFHMLVKGNQGKILSYSVTAVPVIILAVVSIFRGVMALFIDPGISKMTEDPIQAILLVVYASGYLLWAFGSKLIISAELNCRLEKMVIEKSQAVDMAELLVREMNHRIKNNLAVIQGIISFQTLDTTDTASKQRLQESQSRIGAISTIHDMLAHTSDLKQVQLVKYIGDLVEEVSNTFGSKNTYVEIRLDIPDIEVDFDKIVPLALILNELVSNAYLYAFANSPSGAISIEMKRVSEYKYRLMIADDGIGLPENFNPYTQNSMGMNIVRSSVTQLNGQFDFSSAPGVGTEFVIQVELGSKNPRQ